MLPNRARHHIYKCDNNPYYSLGLNAWKSLSWWKRLNFKKSFPYIKDVPFVSSGNWTYSYTSWLNNSGIPNIFGNHFLKLYAVYFMDLVDTNLPVVIQLPDAHSEPIQISNMMLFAKIDYGLDW